MLIVEGDGSRGSGSSADLLLGGGNDSGCWGDVHLSSEPLGS